MNLCLGDIETPGRKKKILGEKLLSPQELVFHMLSPTAEDKKEINHCPITLCFLKKKAYKLMLSIKFQSSKIVLSLLALEKMSPRVPWNRVPQLHDKLILLHCFQEQLFIE